eukprot:scaffold200691_cov38-Prasinocladus_malaysianus.AAC.1
MRRGETGEPNLASYPVGSRRFSETEARAGLAWLGDTDDKSATNRQRASHGLNAHQKAPDADTRTAHGRHSAWIGQTHNPTVIML